jgi:two-component system cell cycle sensor histidine kinase/response regulator CckA
MALSLIQRLSTGQRGLRHHLLIVELLVVIIPFLTLLYIFSTKSLSLESSHMVLIGLMLILILSGLIILRKIFDKVSLLAFSLKEFAGGNRAAIAVQKDTAELYDITTSLHELTNRLEETSGELEDRLFELWTIKDLTKSVRKTLSIDDLLNTLLEKSMNATKAQVGSVLMVESEANRFRVVAARGHEPQLEKGSSINIHDTMLRQVAADGKSLLVQDIETDPRTRKAPDPGLGAPSFLSMPIFMRQGLVGILNLSRKEKHQAFDTHDEDIVAIMVGEIGFALDNARLNSEMIEHLKDLQERTAELTETNDQLEMQIAERKQVEQNLKDTNTFLQDILDSSSSISIISTDLEQNVLFWNKGAENIFGYTAEEIVGNHKIDILYPDDEVKQEVSEIRSLLAREKTNVHRELRERTKDGRTLWVKLNLTPTFDENGNQIGILGVGEDITEQRKMDEELRRSEEKYRTILETMEEGCFEVDLSGNLTFFNNALCTISGYSREELMGMNNRDFTTAETAKRMYRIFNEIYTTGKPAKIMDYEVIKSDGSKVILEMSASLIQGISDRPLGFRGVVRDVTERKRAEQDQKKLEAQLQYAQKMEALGNLAGGIAHNFNNLLMGIMGNTSLLLLESEREGPQYEKLKKIEKLSDSGSLLTKQLLGYAREGRYEIKAINMNRVIKETSDTFAMTKKNVTVHQKLGEELRAVKADQGQIEQVLWNLYVNAADAMPTGGKLFLRTRNVPNEEMKTKPYDVKPGTYVLVTVRDTGVGMDEETMEHIFEPFFTTKGLSRGTGLGLASVYGAVKAHGGYIDVKSRRGIGTTFDIYLPASQEGITEEQELKGIMRNGTETILVLDDEEQILEVSKAMLETLGYTVYTANSGEKAIAMYREYHDAIDMVVLDMIMPDMGGGETYEKLKEINPTIKVLLSSGYSIDGQASEILQRGCDGFIQKPFTMEELSRNLRAILDE